MSGVDDDLTPEERGNHALKSVGLAAASAVGAAYFLPIAIAWGLGSLFHAAFAVTGKGPKDD